MANKDTCPECGSALKWRKGKYGQFQGCSSFPHCLYIKQAEGKSSLEQQADEILRRAGRGDLAEFKDIPRGNFVRR